MAQHDWQRQGNPSNGGGGGEEDGTSDGDANASDGGGGGVEVQGIVLCPVWALWR